MKKLGLLLSAFILMLSSTITHAQNQAYSMELGDLRLLQTFYSEAMDEALLYATSVSDMDARVNRYIKQIMVENKGVVPFPAHIKDAEFTDYATLKREYIKTEAAIRALRTSRYNELASK